MTRPDALTRLSRLKTRCKLIVHRWLYGLLVYLAITYRRRNQTGRSLKFYRSAIRYTQTSEIFETLGQIYEHRQDWDQAVCLYQQAIQRFPQDLQFYERLAAIAQQRNHWHEVVDYLTQICDRGEASAQVYQRIGHAHLKQKQWSQMATAYRSAIVRQPDHYDSYHALGLASIRQNQWAEAVTALTRALELRPEAIRSRAQLCLALAQQQQWRESCQVLAIAIADQRDLFTPVGPWLERFEALDLNQPWPNTAEALEVVIEAGIDAGRYLKIDLAPVADCAFVQGITQFPAHTWSYFAYFNRLLIRFRNQNRLDELCDRLQGAITTTPEAREVYLSLAAIADFRGDYQTSAIVHATLLDRDAGINIHLRDRQADGLMPDPDTRLAPSFCIIGVQKGGTTSLHRYLYEHPQILPPAHKEINFWSLEYNCGLAWYLAQFPSRSANPNAITGEASPTYFDHPDAPARLHSVFPQIKLIVVLRDPTDRAISHYYHRYRERNLVTPIEPFLRSELVFVQQHPPDSIPADRYATHLRGRPLSRGLYSTFIQRWLQFFPREQILVIDSQALFRQTSDVLTRVHHFLDLDPQPLNTYPIHNSGTYRQISPTLEADLRQFFRPYNQELMTILEMDFDWP